MNPLLLGAVVQSSELGDCSSHDVVHAYRQTRLDE